MSQSVCILNFSSGNVGSVKNLFHTLTDRVIISNDPSDIKDATHLVLPGVGAFGSAMEKIRNLLPLEVLEEEVVHKKKPFLGICVGMQVLADKGLEFGEHAGLGWISGVVKKIDCGEHPLPHVGWNDIAIVKDTPLLKGLDTIRDFYFVHSFAFSPKDRGQVCAVADYGESFDCVVNRDNIFGVQFHPEKSQKAGQRLVKNFLEIGSEKNRMIPVLLLRNGWLVQSKGFSRYQNLGNPVTSVKRLSEWASDELIYLDISSEDKHDMRRDDIGHPNRQTFLEIIEDVSKETFMPITVGGRIKTLKDIEARLAVGADKIAINSHALAEPSFIEKAAREFGAQCIVVSIDVLQKGGEAQVLSEGGTRLMHKNAVAWAKEVQERGAGEIFLNSIDRDGAKNGYNLELLWGVSSAVSIPVIGCGGVGKWDHFADAFEKTNVDAVAAANIFHYTDQSVYHAKKFLYKRKYNVRRPDLITI